MDLIRHPPSARTNYATDRRWGWERLRHQRKADLRKADVQRRVAHSAHCPVDKAANSCVHHEHVGRPKVAVYQAEPLRQCRLIRLEPRDCDAQRWAVTNGLLDPRQVTGGERPVSIRT
jgi:hypothetical protein